MPLPIASSATPALAGTKRAATLPPGMSDLPEEYHEYASPSAAVMSLVRNNPQEPFSADTVMQFKVFSGMEMGPPRTGDQGQKCSFVNRGRHQCTFETGNTMTAGPITQPKRYENGEWKIMTDSTQRVLSLDANFQEKDDPHGPAFREAMEQIRRTMIVWTYKHREHLFGKRFAENRRSDPNYDMSIKDVESMVAHPIDPIMGTVTVKYNMSPARETDRLQMFAARHCIGDADDVQLEVVKPENHVQTIADGMTVRTRLQWLGVNVGAKVSAMLRVKVIVIMKKNTVPIMSSLRNAKVVADQQEESEPPQRQEQPASDSEHEIQEASDKEEEEARSEVEEEDFGF